MIGPDPLVRPWQPGDEERLRRMFRRLSTQTVYRRFFTVVDSLDGPVLRALTDVDHMRHEALVILIGDEIVALASYHVRRDDPTVADVAVVVEDGWQHHGLGRRLMRRLTALARSRGVLAFHADVLPDNRAAVGLIHRVGGALAGGRGRFEHGELAYDLPLVPTAA